MWKEVREYWLNDSPMARGNTFNRKAEVSSWYDYNEIHLANGKRLDSYVLPLNGQQKEIISRKATNLDEIDLLTFETYLINTSDNFVERLKKKHLEKYFCFAKQTLSKHR